MMWKQHITAPLVIARHKFETSITFRGWSAHTKAGHYREDHARSLNSAKSNNWVRCFPTKSVRGVSAHHAAAAA
jgi:hypothetical protein